jgi:hypothetical protein
MVIICKCKRCGKDKVHYPDRKYACVDCINTKVREYKKRTNYNKEYKKRNGNTISI